MEKSAAKGRHVPPGLASSPNCIRVYYGRGTSCIPYRAGSDLCPVLRGLCGGDTNAAGRAGWMQVVVGGLEGTRLAVWVTTTFSTRQSSFNFASPPTAEQTREDRRAADVRRFAYKGEGGKTPYRLLTVDLQWATVGYCGGWLFAGCSRSR